MFARAMTAVILWYVTCIPSISKRLILLLSFCAPAMCVDGSNEWYYCRIRSRRRRGLPGRRRLRIPARLRLRRGLLKELTRVGVRVRMRPRLRVLRLYRLRVRLMRRKSWQFGEQWRSLGRLRWGCWCCRYNRYSYLIVLRPRNYRDKLKFTKDQENG